MSPKTTDQPSDEGIDYHKHTPTSNLLLVNDETVWKCHKAVLVRSSFFLDAIKNDPSHLSSGRVEVRGEDPAETRAVVLYLYYDAYIGSHDKICAEDECNNLPCGFHTIPELLDELNLHIRMMHVAKRHALPGLAGLAVCKFNELLKTHTSWTTWHALIKSDIGERVKNLPGEAGHDMGIGWEEYMGGDAEYGGRLGMPRPIVYFRKHQWDLCKYWAKM